MSQKIKIQTIEKTQKTLGKFIQKPQLTEKLLTRPPFRFLHDVINAVIKNTGFLNGVFSNDELNSENVKEKDGKIAFLTKLIDAVKTITNTELAVRPNKIIAGLEPTETNILLQTIAKGIESKLDSTKYLEKTKKPEKTKKKSTEKSSKTSKPKPTEIAKNHATVKKRSSTRTETQNSTDREKTSSKHPKNKTTPKTENEHPPKTTIPPEEKQENNESTENPIKTEPIELKNTENPPNPEPEELKNSETNTQKPEPIELDNKPETPPETAKEPIEKQPTVETEEEKRTLRPPSVRPSSARPGAPRLRPDSALTLTQEVTAMGKINVIVENYDKDEEETVIIQNSEEPPENGSLENLNAIGENRGHLVDQILEQMHEGNEEPKLLDDWPENGLLSKDTANKEINNLRSMIQSMTRTVNPLGKLITYLHEDIDAMDNELEMWTKTKKQLSTDINKQKRLSAEMNQPLLQQLQKLHQEIRRQEQEIINIKNNILRNDEKIKNLVRK